LTKVEGWDLKIRPSTSKRCDNAKQSLAPRAFNYLSLPGRRKTKLAYSLYAGHHTICTTNSGETCKLLGSVSSKDQQVPGFQDIASSDSLTDLGSATGSTLPADAQLTASSSCSYVQYPSCRSPVEAHGRLLVFGDLGRVNHKTICEVTTPRKHALYTGTKECSIVRKFSRLTYRELVLGSEKPIFQIGPRQIRYCEHACPDQYSCEPLSRDHVFYMAVYVRASEEKKPRTDGKRYVQGFHKLPIIQERTSGNAID